jgi:selenide,water dikinase
MIATTTKLNTAGPDLGRIAGVHALTDVTGFGLLGHLLEIARGSALAAELDFASLPLLPNALAYAQSGYVTGASGRNWNSYGDAVSLDGGLGQVEQALLTDPQTSGGLLVSCAADSVGEVLAVFGRHGFHDAKVIGRLKSGSPAVSVA